jgi:5-methylcytosine-specific restriction enzyme B
LGAQPVEAVWVWLFGISAQKATYGRFGEDTSFTKDFLQVSGECRDLMNEIFPIIDNREKRDLTYLWPRGTAEGFVKHSNDRHHLSWRTGDGAPLPWKMTLTPNEFGPETIPGDPTAQSADAANRVLEAFAATSLKAYLLAIKLVGEPDVLHLRAYISNPPEDLAFADTAQLPHPVLALTTQVTSARACASIRLAADGTALTPEVAELIVKLRDNPNVLLVGPPGTGKTVLLEKLIHYVENPGAGVEFDPEVNHAAWSESADAEVPGMTRTVVLHPSYSYDNLVVGLLPTPSDHGIAVKAIPGPLVSLAHFASHGSNRALLVLDEFNRGNAAGVLGDTLALLDKDKRGRAHIDLPYSELEIAVLDEFNAGGGTAVQTRFTLPPNLWIVAAMNSSDRSVAPIDAALRRRFSIVEMRPDYSALAQQLGADLSANLERAWSEWTTGHVGKLAVVLLQTLNDRIDAVLGRDFELGHSNFWHVSGVSAGDALSSLGSAWDRRVSQTMRMALQDDDDSLAAIFVAGTSRNATASNAQNAAWWKAADTSLGTYARARLHLNQIAQFETVDLLAELKRLAGM